MSHLQLPRIHFGGDFSANVCTGNNDDIAAAHPDKQFVNSAIVQIDTMGMSDDEFSEWIRQADPPFGIRGGWNLYGDDRCKFDNVTVQSVHPVGSDLLTSEPDDAFIGANVRLKKASMVDLDPEGTLGTQIFADDLDVRHGSTRIQGRGLRFYSRFVSQRNLGASGFTRFAAVWNAVIPALNFSVSGDSPTAESFRVAKTAGKGIFISFCTYLLAPQIAQSQLISDFENGIATENPAIGKVIGTIGTASPNEMTSLPKGRRLNSSLELQHDHQVFRLNPAIAHVDTSRKVVALDMVNTFPEIDSSLAKVNIGDVTLEVVTEDNNGMIRDKIGDIQYDLANYDQSSGICDVAYIPELEQIIEQGKLVVVNNNTGLVLTEKETTIETDDRAVYFEYNETKTIELVALVSGSQPNQDVAVDLVQLVTSNRTFNVATPENRIVDIPLQVTIPASGVLSLSVTATNPGTCVVLFVPTGDDPVMREFFTNIRVLPEDDFSSIDDDDVTFDFVYQNVLKYYHHLYPAMNEKGFDLSDETLVNISAERIKDRISLDEWSKAIYMPVTRELSAGKRALLDRYCSKQLGITPEQVAVMAEDESLHVRTRMAIRRMITSAKERALEARSEEDQ